MASFNGWAVALLRAANLPVTKANLNNLALWQRAEGGSAAFNPLNTTQPASGASNYNSVGVKNFTSAGQGVQATADTLHNGHYGNILALLQKGNASAKQFGTAVAQSPWGTGSGILREIGSGPVALPKGGASAAASVPAIGAPGGGNTQQQLALAMLAQSSATAQGSLDPSNILSMALERQAAGLQAMGASSPRTPSGAVMAAVSTGGLQFTGASLQGTNPQFAGKVTSALKSLGATHVDLASAFRSTSHNASVGGVSNSNHTYGHALDGKAYIPGRGWVPLGVALKPIASKFGLRSGDVPGFFNGGPDPEHVDDGYNLNH